MNNNRISGDALLKEWLDAKLIRYGVCQQEKSASGTLHLQIYVILAANPRNRKGRTLSWVKEHLDARTHWEPRRGTHEEARGYCSEETWKGKSKGRVAGPWEVGTYLDGRIAGGKMTGAKHKAAIADVIDAVKAGATDRDLLQDPELRSMAFRMPANISRARNVLRVNARSWHSYCYVYYGPTGTGKTETLLKISKKFKEEDVYWLPRPEANEGVWWDAYDGQQVVIIDEFDGWITYTQFLKLCDRTPMLVRTKGGFTPFLAKMIVVASNKHPNQWWTDKSVPDVSPLMRRLAAPLGKLTLLDVPYVGPSHQDVVPAETYLDAVMAQEDAPLTAVIDLTEEEEVAESPDSLDLADLAHQDDIDEDADFDDKVYDASTDEEGAHDLYKVYEPARKRSLEFHRVVEPEGQCDACVYCNCFRGDLPCDVTGKFRKLGPEPVQTALSFARPRSGPTPPSDPERFRVDDDF